MKLSFLFVIHVGEFVSGTRKIFRRTQAITENFQTIISLFLMGKGVKGI